MRAICYKSGPLHLNPFHGFPCSFQKNPPNIVMSLRPGLNPPRIMGRWKRWVSSGRLLSPLIMESLSPQSISPTKIKELQLLLDFNTKQLISPGWAKVGPGWFARLMDLQTVFKKDLDGVSVLQRNMKPGLFGVALGLLQTSCRAWKLLLMVSLTSLSLV